MKYQTNQAPGNDQPTPSTLQEFTMGFGHKISQLSSMGLWLVTASSKFDLGMLFWRVQEFYESPNPELIGRPFSLLDYMKWYSDHCSEENSFTYFSDFEGYNVPCEVIQRCNECKHPDFNRYDALMMAISREIEYRQGGKYYLIGALQNDVETLDHEIAHGIYYLFPEYKAAMNKLVDLLGPHRDVMFKALKSLSGGYTDAVLYDEAQAYMSTWLTDGMESLEFLRKPFINVFKSAKKILELS
jgi:hypothetical protein